LEAVNRSSALWQQFGFLGDVIHVTESGSLRYYEALPVEYVRSCLMDDSQEYYLITLEYGDRPPDDIFAASRVHREAADRGDESQFLHPVIRHYVGGRIAGTHHVIEDLESVWNEPIHTRPLRAFFDQAWGTARRMTGRSPQVSDVTTSDVVVEILMAQANAIWPLEEPLFDRYAIAPGARILDVGCGTGLVTERIAARFPEASVLGVDLHSLHFDRAWQARSSRPNLTFREADAFELDLPDASVDLVVCRHVLHALQQPELVVQQLFRVLQPGGHVHLLLEDYGMIHFAGTRLNTERFWRDAVWCFADAIDNDPRIGRKGLPLLTQAGFEAVSVVYLPLDSTSPHRERFARIWEAWAKGYTDPLAEHTDLSRTEIKAHWDDMINAIRTGYAVWQVPIWSGRRASSP
jgi:ubiquinone/menaquinone biosynthesis C-methylase UbiE